MTDDEFKCRVEGCKEEPMHIFPRFQPSDGGWQETNDPVVWYCNKHARAITTLVNERLAINTNRWLYDILKY